MSCGTLDWLDKGVSLWTLDIIVSKSMDPETFGMIWNSPKIIKVPQEKRVADMSVVLHTPLQVVVGQRREGNSASFSGKGFFKIWMEENNAKDKTIGL